MGISEAMNFVSGKLKDILGSTESMVMNINLRTGAMAVKNLGNKAMDMFDKLGTEAMAVENLPNKAMAWFDKVFPPGTRAEMIQHWIHVAQPFLVSAFVLTVVFYLCRRCCCLRRRAGVWKMMKAPGRNLRMPRSVFESDPKGYFRNLRAYPGDNFV